MSKVNRRKEIQEKDAFRLNFQLALAQNTKHVLNWLPAAKPTENKEDSGTDDREKFMDLPVIANGQGLFLSDTDDMKHSSTVGDFLRAEDFLAKETSADTRDPRSGSKAMTALMNRMRTDKRKTLEKDQSNKNTKGSHGIQKTYKKLELMAAIKKPAKKPQVSMEAEDSDEEISKMSQISGKKRVPQTGKKGKARPF